MSDGDLQALKISLAAGQQPAFAALYDRFGAAMYRTALRITGRAEDAEDVVQEVFVSLVRGRRKLADVDDLAGYVFTAMKRSAFRAVERRSRQPTTSEHIESLCVELEPVAGNERSQELERALANLPVEQRQVVALKIDAGLTFEQIGKVMQLSPNTAASRYRYALEKLRNSLGANR